MGPGNIEGKMPDNQLLKCSVSVPDTASEVQFRWEITPPSGAVKIYRTPTDPTPQTLRGPSGEGCAELVEPVTIYYEFMPGTVNFKLWTLGWTDDLNRPLPETW